MTLSTMNTADIPATARGGSPSRLPADEQDMLRKIATSGDAATDGKTYPTAKAARIAGNKHRRFLRRLIADGEVDGKVRCRTWHDGTGKKAGFRWAVHVAR